MRIPTQMKWFYRVLFLVTLSFLFIIESHAQSIKYERLGNNKIQFWVVDLPDIELDCPDNFFEGNYNYFWSFGDGEYSQEARPIHEYHSAGTFRVKVESNSIYSTEEPTVIVLEEDIIINGRISNLSARRKVRNGQFKVWHNRPLLMNEKVGFVLRNNYELRKRLKNGNWNHQGVTNSFIAQDSLIISFEFPNNQFQFLEAQPLEDMNGNNIWNMVEGNNSTKVQWKIEANNIKLAETADIFHNLFVNLIAGDTTVITLGSTIPFPYTVDLFRDNTIVNIIQDTIRLRVGKSFDPNMKEVNYANIPGQQQLKYRIHFQNLGDGPATRVRIEDQIDTWTHMRSLVVRKVVVGVNTIPVSDLIVSRDRINDIVEFDLQGIRLLGTGEPGYDACAAESTMGYIEYTINTINFTQQGIPDGSIFGTYADIYFDDNGAIRTNTAYTRLDQNNSFCPVDFDDQTSTYSPGNQIVFHTVQNNITTENVIYEPNTYSEFDAGNSITLKATTHLQGNSLLRIDGCTSPGTPSFRPKNKHIVDKVIGGLEKLDQPDLGFDCYPNPLEESAVLRFELLEDSPVELVLYDLSGRMVKSWYRGEWQSEGKHQVSFSRSSLLNGLYFCILKTNHGIGSQKIKIVD